MKKKNLIIVAVAAFIMLMTYSNINFAHSKIKTSFYSSNAINIKLKNDGADEITVINAGSGGTYRLQKNIVTTIKMDAGDKLFIVVTIFFCKR
jgi:hypothetical protein